MKNSKTPYGKAAPWMVGAIFSFISMAIAGRAVSDQLDTFEIMLYRSLIGFLVVISTARVVNTHHEINFQNFSFFGSEPMVFCTATNTPRTAFCTRVYITNMGCAFGSNIFKRKINI